jgi:coenzyme F420 biosynthesis associated uncharacterized protein
MSDARESGGPSVDWRLASSAAGRVLAWKPPLDEATFAEVEADFVDATRRAEVLVAEITGLRPASGHARAVTVGRVEWVDANLASFARLIGPVLARSADSGWSRIARRAPIGKQAAGVEIGMLLAWLSSRVLGQYDILPGTPDGEDAVYYVAPNIVGVERRHGFAPRDFRLWIAVHEVTHRMQFTGVEWMEPYFLDLVERATSISFDSSALLDSLNRLVASVRGGENPLGESGIVGLFASGSQLATMREAQALMSLLEGHADTVMAAVGDDVIPGASRFARVLSERREHARGGAKFLQQLLGIEAKLRQYREGEEFVDAVISARGMAGFSRVWGAAENLPTMEEIRDPRLWLTRVDGSVAPTA